MSSFFADIVRAKMNEGNDKTPDELFPDNGVYIFKRPYIPDVYFAVNLPSTTKCTLRPAFPQMTTRPGSCFHDTDKYQEIIDDSVLDYLYPPHDSQIETHLEIQNGKDVAQKMKEYLEDNGSTNYIYSSYQIVKVSEGTNRQDNFTFLATHLITLHNKKEEGWVKTYDPELPTLSITFEPNDKLGFKLEDVSIY